MTKKIKSILSFGTVLTLAIIALSACEPAKLTENDVFYPADDATVANLTADRKIFNLDDFVAEFCKNEKGDYDLDGAGYRTRGHSDGSDIWLFSINNIPEDTIGLYIRGRIATDDYGGNYYKALVIQQVIKDASGNITGQQALRISVDMGSVGGLYQQGQEILIRCNGLAIGRYANQPQLCVPSYNNNIYANKAAEKVGWAPGRIPSSRFAKAVKMLGHPDKSKLYYATMTMDELYTNYLNKYMDGTDVDLKKVRYLDGHLVKIKDVYFTGKYYNINNSVEIKDCKEYIPAHSDTIITTGDPEHDEYTNVFAPTTQNRGNPVSRIVTSDINNTNNVSISISASEYAKYARYYLPSTIDTTMVTESGLTCIKHTFHYTRVRGTISGIIDYYADNAGKSTVANPCQWAIKPCGLEDFDMYVTDDSGVRQKDAAGNDIPWQPKEFSLDNYYKK